MNDEFNALQEKLISQYNKASSLIESLTTAGSSEGTIAHDILQNAQNSLNDMENTIIEITQSSESWDKKLKRKARHLIKDMKDKRKLLHEQISKHDENSVAIVLDDNIIEVSDDSDPEKQILTTNRRRNSGIEDTPKGEEEDYRLCTLQQFISYILAFIVFLAIVYSIMILWI